MADHVGGAEVRTLSLPLGVWPPPRELAYAGEHEGGAYAHEGVLLVGAGPTSSSFSSGFEPPATHGSAPLPGTTVSQDFWSGYWFDWFDDNPDQRYIPDGDPFGSRFPQQLTDDLDRAFADAANPY